jgi:hypothetical protein
MARRRNVRGVAAVQKLLRIAPENVGREIVKELHLAGPKMLARMRQKAPHRTGALRRGLSYKVYPKTLRLQVGLIGTKRGRSKLFYARIQDLGRKGQIVTAKRFRAGGQRIVFKGRKTGPDLQLYPIRVPAMTGKRFVTGRMPDLRAMLQRGLKLAWKRALSGFVGGSE